MRPLRNIFLAATYGPKCCVQHFGPHLLRELQAVTDSNGWPWAERMRKLLLIARRQVMRRPDRRLSMRHYRRIARCYREILEQGRKEMPEIPKRRKGRRGPVARSDAHNLLERLDAQRRNVLRFTRRADTPFSNNRAYADKFFMPTFCSKSLTSRAFAPDLSA